MRPKHINTFPHFTPNQVLSDAHLNGLQRFLDQQNRLTRSHGIGAGIVCGLHASYQYSAECGEHVILLTPGYGFSSDGYLIQIDPVKGPQTEGETGDATGRKSTRCVEVPAGQLAFTHVRAYDWPERDVFSEGEREKIYEKWRKGECESVTPAEPTPAKSSRAKHQPSAKNRPQGSAATTWELLPAEMGIQHSMDSEELHELHLTDRVLVLFLEKGTRTRKPCVNTDCGPHAEVAYSVRALLIPFACFEREKACDALPLLHVPRLHTHAFASNPSTGKGPDPLPGTGAMAHLHSYQDINTAYGRIVEGMAANQKSEKSPLWQAIEAAYSRYEHLLNLSEEVDMALMESLMDHYFQVNRFDLNYHQYHYDFVRDLVTAHNEFVAAACDLIGSCWPVKGFPRHLALLGFSQNDNVMTVHRDGIRTGFYPSPVQQTATGTWKHARALFLRLRDLICFFSLDHNIQGFAKTEHTQLPIRITPSQTAQYALGRRAIPYYYDLTDAAAKKTFSTHWQPTDCCTDEALLSYHWQDVEARHSPYSIEAIQVDPLAFDLLSKGFYRIEGHLGKDCMAAAAELEQLRQRHHVEFDLVFIHIGDPQQGGNSPTPDSHFFYTNAAEFFGDLGPAIGMEHMAGVPVGGTFVVICDEVCVDQETKRMESVVVADFSLHRSLACCFSRNQTKPTHGYSTIEEKREVPVAPIVATTSQPITSSALAKVVDSRALRHHQEMVALNANGGFEGNATYQSAVEYVRSHQAGDELLETFDGLMKRVLQLYKQTRETNKKQAYKQILERMLYRTLDAIVLGTSLTKAQGELLQEQLTSISEADIALSRIATNWKAQELGAAPVVDQLLKLLTLSGQ